jgi:hypothetical protein
MNHRFKTNTVRILASGALPAANALAEPVSPTNSAPATESGPTMAENVHQRHLLLIFMAFLLLIAAVRLWRGRNSRAPLKTNEDA